MGVEILYEDKDIFVVLKPAGMPSQEERSTAMDMVSYLKNLSTMAQGYSKPPYVAPVHRLDRPVGGVMVYARTPQAAKYLSQQFQTRQVKKTYQALLAGVLPDKEGRLCHYLQKDGRANCSKVVEAKSSGAKEAILRYNVLEQRRMENGQDITRVQICLETGRHHQIRVQMAAVGAPVLGDTKYGNVTLELDLGGLALFSYGLEFNHPVTKRHLAFYENSPFSIDNPIISL